MLTWDDEDGEYYAGQLLKGRIEVIGLLDAISDRLSYFPAGSREKDYEVPRSVSEGKETKIIKLKSRGQHNILRC